MTPKEKSKELIESFAETIPPKFFGQLMERDWETANKCALIAAQEILSVLGSINDSPYTTLKERQFYTKVKIEIKKL